MSIPDQSIRDRIKNELDKSFLVEAGAGSGKTHELVRRLVALIESGVEAEHLAAITFTRKAAGELRIRFKEGLEQSLDKAQKAGDTAKVELLRLAIYNVERAFMGTIHSFCGRLLRERPVEAGLDPSFTEGDSVAMAFIGEEVWQEYLDDCLRKRHPLPPEFDSAGLKLNELRPLYRTLGDYEDVEFPAIKRSLPRKKLTDAIIRLLDFYDYADPLVPTKMPTKGWDKVQWAIRNTRWKRKRLDTTDLVEVGDFLASFGNKGTKVKAFRTKIPNPVQWGTSKADGLAVQKRFKPIHDDIRAALQSWWEYRYPILLEAVLPAVRLFHERRIERGVLSYQDLLLRSRWLLKESPARREVREYFADRYRHIFVDEFQDTDPVQAEIVFLLSATDPSQDDWLKATPRPGSLFLVGDPKQSIYRFRRADISTYNLVADKMGSNVLHLTATFRLLPELCEDLNPAFKNEFSKSSTDVQANYTDLEDIRPKTSEPAVYHIEHSGDPRKTPVTKTAEDDAGIIARFIASACAGNWQIEEDSFDGDQWQRTTRQPRPGDFLILARHKTYLEVYARALEEESIPVEVSGSSAFGSEDIGPFFTLLMAAATPENPIPFVAWLRGPLRGISDDALYQFRCAGGNFTSFWSVFMFFEDARKTKSTASMSSELVELDQACQQMKHAIDLTRELSPAMSVEAILEDSGLLPAARTAPAGGARAGALLRVLNLARRMDAEGLTFRQVVDRLHDLVEDSLANSSEEAESLSLHPASTSGVRLMNLHKAKGLEAPIVFLAEPRRLANHEPSIHIDRSSGQPVGYLKIKGEGSEEWFRKTYAQPAKWETYEKVEEEFRDAEEVRLIYVAATRAKDLLVVSSFNRYQSPRRAPLVQRPWYPWCKELPDRKLPVLPDLPRRRKRKLTTRQRQPVLDQIQANRQQISAPGYAHVTAHDLVDKGTPIEAANRPRRRPSVRGDSWGTVIHNILADVASYRRAPTADLVKRFLRKEDLDENLADVAIEDVMHVMSSDLWKRMEAAEKVLAEVPFTMRLEDKDDPALNKQADANGLPVNYAGTIDLAFKEPDGWVIVDYKTDNTAGRLENLKQHYAPQLALYRIAWNQILPEPVKECHLLFVEECVDGGLRT